MVVYLKGFSSHELKKRPINTKQPSIKPRSSRRLEESPTLSDDISVDSTSHTDPAKWSGAYEPPPLVDQSTILCVGFFVFGLALVWPPLIILFAYVASKLIPYSFRRNDDPTSRRKLQADFIRHAEDLPARFSEIPNHIQLEDSYWQNERGMLLHTVTMMPKHRPIKAVVCFCHGYTDDVSFMKQVENQRLVEAGIAFCGIEYEGHGLSDGSMGLINDWDCLIDDVTSYFRHLRRTKFAASQQGPPPPFFLMGESMGGAVAFCTYNRLPELFRGVVFVCPMCKISDEMLPPQPVVDFLKWLIGGKTRHNSQARATSMLGYLPIAPSRNQLANVSHRVPSKRRRMARSPLVFGRNPRLATARELIDATRRISNGGLQEFEAPFLVVHGKADVVTDPHLSQALYEESKSSDKSIRLYDGMWHALTSGEPDENVDRVFRDCIDWILARC